MSKYAEIVEAVGEQRAEELIVQDMGTIEAVHDHLVATGTITPISDPDDVPLSEYSLCDDCEGSGYTVADQLCGGCGGLGGVRP